MNNSAKKVLLGAVGAASLFVASTSVSANTTHKVTSNDTVWGLSQKFGVSIKSIEQLNHISTDSHLITVGQNVQLPSKGASVKTPVKQSVPSTPKSNATYTVKSGDSLYTIAQSHGVSVAALRQANSLTGSALQIGQKLVINGSAAQGATTQVQQPAAAQSQAQSQSQQAPAANNAQVQQSQQQAQPQQSAQVQSQAQPQQSTNNSYAAQGNTTTARTTNRNSNSGSQGYTNSQPSNSQGNNNNAGSANYSSVVGYANSFSGSRYVYGGNDPSGFDCSGFTRYVYAKYGKSLPRTSQAQANAGTRISSSQARPGDLIITNGGNHVGISTGNGNFISAENPHDGVATSSLKYWGPSYAVRLK